MTHCLSKSKTLMTDKMFCRHRGLFIKPEQDCRYCAWYECEQHPYHVPYGMLWDKALSKCPLMKHTGRSDMKGCKIEWDERQETCRRWRWFQGHGRREEYGDPCETCTLPRKCKHRGETGRLDMEIIECRKKS